MTQEFGHVRNLLNWVVKIQGMFYNEFATCDLLSTDYCHCLMILSWVSLPSLRSMLI